MRILVFPSLLLAVERHYLNELDSETKRNLEEEYRQIFDTHGRKSKSFYTQFDSTNRKFTRNANREENLNPASLFMYYIYQNFYPDSQYGETYAANENLDEKLKLYAVNLGKSQKSSADFVTLLKEDPDESDQRDISDLKFKKNLCFHKGTFEMFTHELQSAYLYIDSPKNQSIAWNENTLDLES